MRTVRVFDTYFPIVPRWSFEDLKPRGWKNGIEFIIAQKAIPFVDFSLPAQPLGHFWSHWTYINYKVRIEVRRR